MTGDTLQRARGNGYPVRGADRARKSQKTPGTKPITSDRPLVHLDGSNQNHVLGEFSSWDRDPRSSNGSDTEEGGRSIAGTRLRLGCRGSTLRRDAPHRGIPGDCFPLGSHAAMPPVARAAEKRPPPPFLTLAPLRGGDFPSKVRRPEMTGSYEVSVSVGCCSKSANWEVAAVCNDVRTREGVVLTSVTDETDLN